MQNLNQEFIEVPLAWVHQYESWERKEATEKAEYQKKQNRRNKSVCFIERKLREHKDHLSPTAIWVARRIKRAISLENNYGLIAQETMANERCCTVRTIQNAVSELRNWCVFWTMQTDKPGCINRKGVNRYYSGEYVLNTPLNKLPHDLRGPHNKRLKNIQPDEIPDEEFSSLLYKYIYNSTDPNITSDLEFSDDSEIMPADSPRHELDTELADRESMPYPEDGCISFSASAGPPTYEPASAPQEPILFHSEPGKLKNSLRPTDRDEEPHPAAQCTREDDWEDLDDLEGDDAWEDDGAYHPCHDREEVDHSSWKGKYTEWPLANYRIIFTAKIVREEAENTEKTETSEVNFDIISAPTQAVGGRAGTCQDPIVKVSRPMTEVDYTIWDLYPTTAYRVLH